MTILSIPTPFKNILIVGTCAGKTDKLLRVQTMIPNYDLTVFLGGAYYRWQNHSEVDRNIDIIEECIATGLASYCMSHEDLMLTGGLVEDIGTKRGDFFSKCPNVIEASFHNGNKIVMLNGGITPKTTEKKLHHDLEVSFTADIGGKSWHQFYDGRFGYVISNNPTTLQEPKFHNFSAQIGNNRGENSQVYAQEADQFGLKRTILL